MLFDFGDFQIPVNELVTGKVRFPPAPLFNMLLLTNLRKQRDVRHLFGNIKLSFHLKKHNDYLNYHSRLMININQLQFLQFLSPSLYMNHHYGSK